MSVSAPLTRPGARGANATAIRHRTHAGRRTWPGVALLVALLAAILYAAFAAGATGPPAETRVQVLFAVLVAAACAAWLWDGGIRVRATPLAWVGVVLLVAFTAWTGTTVLWSVAPDSTWIELNRGLAYLLVLVLAIAAGATVPRALELTALGFLAVAVVVAVYALGGKVAPGLHVDGLFDLNHTSGISRLRAPLEYWNALGLVCALAVPIALRVTADAARRTPLRLAALAALYLLLVVLGMTYSRGAMLAVSVAVVACVALATPRGRVLLLFAAACMATVVPLGYAFSRPALTTNGASLADRIDAGGALGVLVLVALVVLLAAGWLLFRLDRRLAGEPGRARRIARVGAVAAGAAALVLVAGAVASPQVGQGVSQTAERLTTQRQDDKTDPRRLTSTNSGNRGVWWREAAGAVADRPVQGWGAGSFYVLHLRYRKDQLNVLQPHNVPLQWGAETGLVGLALGLGAFIVLLVAGVATARRLEGSERALAAALWGAAAAWLVHGVFDWDWDIPGVTLPTLLFLGALAGRGGALAFGDEEEPRRGPVARSLGLGLVSILALAAVLSFVLPVHADERADDALAQVGERPTPAQLDDAQRQGEQAAELNPLSVRGLYAAAAVAQRRRDLLAARSTLLRAVERQPDNVEVWIRLARIDLLRADGAGVRRATARALELDPMGERVRRLAAAGVALETLPSESATATGTPLSRRRGRPQRSAPRRSPRRP